MSDVGSHKYIFYDYYIAVRITTCCLELPLDTAFIIQLRITKIFDMINSSLLHLFNSVPTDTSLCYQNKINYIILKKNKNATCNENCLAKEKILTLIIGNI